MRTAPPPTPASRALDALIALNTPGGSTRAQVARHLSTPSAPVSDAAALALLNQLVKKGAAAKLGVARFYAAGHAPPAPPPPPAVAVEELAVGAGAAATAGARVTVAYRGTLATGGAQFDAAERFVFELGAGEVIKGWDAGVAGMRVGGARRLTVPPELAYGTRGAPPDIPPSATLVFDIRLLAVRT